MLKAKIFTIYVLLKSLFCPCAWDHKSNHFETTGNAGYTIKKVGRLDPALNESSGLQATEKEGEIVLQHINDGGGKAEIYETNINGTILNTIKIPDAKNRDWEDLARDDQGNYFIGDIGNNANTRKNLVIYKFNPLQNKTEEIHYNYPDQKAFPPDKEERNFDAEAFFWFKNQLYIFSKNRGNKCVKIYTVPDKPGTYQAKFVGQTPLSAMITSADINSDKTMFSLSGYGKIYLFGIKDSVNFNHPITCRRFAKSGQAEAISFINKTDLIVTNEGRKVFLVKKRK